MSSAFQRTLDLPIPGSGCGDVRITFKDLAVRAEFEYRSDGKDLIGQLVFRNVVSFRFRDEMHSAGFVVEGYDCVVTVEGSTWLEELNAIEPSGMHGIAGSKHFAVLLSNNGYLEVVASDVTLEPPRIGLLGSAVE
jgi:hypothetical protein